VSTSPVESVVVGVTPVESHGEETGVRVSIALASASA